MSTSALFVDQQMRIQLLDKVDDFLFMGFGLFDATVARHRNVGPFVRAAVCHTVPGEPKHAHIMAGRFSILTDEPIGVIPVIRFLLPVGTTIIADGFKNGDFERLAPFQRNVDGLRHDDIPEMLVNDGAPLPDQTPFRTMNTVALFSGQHDRDKNLLSLVGIN